MSGLYNVSTSPHIRSVTSTTTIMQDVALALVPASIFGVYNFGIRALLVILVCIGTCVLTEYAYEKYMKKPITIGDYSAVVTGIILALNLTANIPLWIAALGSVFAILVVKMIFGGIGQNFMNPALAARCFLLISFAGKMSDFTIKAVNGSTMQYLYRGAASVDGITSATPLQALKAGETVNLMSMFMGNIGGTIGETSAIALLIGAIYLLAKKIITWRIPVMYLATFAFCMLLFGGNGLDVNFILGELLGGGLIFGAFFMATDYTTSPITFKGQLLFGAVLGILTSIFRIFGASAEGVSYAIIFGNMLVPLIENITLPTAFGKGGKVNG